MKKTIVTGISLLACISSAANCFAASPDALHPKTATPRSSFSQLGSSRIDGGDYWTTAGGPQGGNILSMVTSLNSDVFAGTLGGGIFRSND
jgi:hypothetical protein